MVPPRRAGPGLGRDCGRDGTGRGAQRRRGTRMQEAAKGSFSGVNADIKGREGMMLVFQMSVRWPAERTAFSRAYSRIIRIVSRIRCPNTYPPSINAIVKEDTRRGAVKASSSGPTQKYRDGAGMLLILKGELLVSAQHPTELHIRRPSKHPLPEGGGNYGRGVKMCGNFAENREIMRKFTCHLLRQKHL